MTDILITGASGFVGRALSQTLSQRGLNFNCFNRANNADVFAARKFSTVIHLAARVHVMNEASAEPLVEFRKANVTETLVLAHRAAAAGVKRFVYVSSVKVNGEQTDGKAFTERDAANPGDPYAISKHEAELGLREFAINSGIDVVIVRPPLVYGVGVKANFSLLANIAGKGIPLPLGAIHNQRSMVYLGNLVDFLILCAQPTLSPLAANETFLISDGQDVSTTYLLKTLAKAQGKSARLLPIPTAWLRFALKCLNKQSIAQRLLGDLQIDSSKARTLLGWKPPYTAAQGLADCVSKK